jgi:hypothetical protein
MRAPIILSALCLLLAACGNSRNDTAVDACSKAIAAKLEGKTFRLDRGDMLGHAADQPPDVVHVASTVVFDQGLSTQYQQTFDCRVRIGKTADVIALQFNWSKADMKKAQGDSG